MVAGPSWIDTAKGATVEAVAGELGLDVRRRAFGPCPGCGAERAAVVLDGLHGHHPLREVACDLRTALAELASPEGIGAAGVSALRLVGCVDDDDGRDP